MQIAVISDIHGNWHALNKVMTEILRYGVDKIVCLGDIVNPLSSSKDVLEFMVASDIPCIRGNHEDYIISGFRNPNHDINKLPQFKPIHWVMKSMSDHHVETMEALPLKRVYEDPKAGSITFCHASPNSNTRGWRFGVNDEISTSLQNESSKTIVCGHWHEPQITEWKDKTLVTAGSVGLPLRGQTKAEFLLLQSADGFWKPEHIAVEYDVEASVDEFLTSRFFHNGGPMAWLLACELATATRQVSTFFQWSTKNGLLPPTVEDWAKAVREFLESRNQWSLIESFLEK